jgi:hypothetical protein
MTPFSAPIPGANYTSETKNYPWHRPPDIVSFDDGVEYLMQKLAEQESTELTFSLLQMDIPITSVCNVLLRQLVTKGKFGIDLAILLAGPLARYIEIIANDSGIKHEMGVDDKARIAITPTVLKMSMGIIDEDEDEAQVIEAAPEEESAGLMAPPSAEEPVTQAASATQDEMLGLMENEEEEQV